ncbi:MAG: hypothetical protein LBD10_07395, partial [Desulfobulbus sp.]|uniref:hypothetical protein n=1 Tax=Desulfobulbus sp. TaxID=895 RepID=UPI00284BAE34
SFVALCEHHRKNEAAWANGHNGSSLTATWCATCKGKHRPQELTIIALADFARKEKRTKEKCMAPRKQTMCDGCGKDKTLSMCSGEMLCSSCAALAGNVVRQSAVVAKMLVKRGKPEEFVGLLVAELGRDWLETVVQSHLPERLAVPVENDVLERIAEAVGYDGGRGDDLVEAVAGMTAALKAVGEGSAAKQGLVEQLSGRIEELKTTRLPSSALIRALDCSLDQWEAAAIQTAAILEEKERQQPTRPPILGELLEIKPLPVRSSLDSLLLDLSISIHRGEVSGIDPDWIALVREVA